MIYDTFDEAEIERSMMQRKTGDEWAIKKVMHKGPHDKYATEMYQTFILSKKGKRNPVRKNKAMRYYLYDLLPDYSKELIKGKSDFGTLAHAKEAAKKKVTWHRDPTWFQGGGKTTAYKGTAYKGYSNKRMEYIITKKPLRERDAAGPLKNPCNYKTLLKNPSRRFTAKQLSVIRKNFAPIKGIDPESETYKDLIVLLDGMPQVQLKQLAAAKIKFLSGLARNRIKRKGNPHMAKKKRSVKQLANDRRLGRMAKARAKAKRGGRRKKVARKNPHRQATRKGRIQTAIGKAKRKVSAKSHLWLLFKCSERAVQFFFVSAAPTNWTSDKGQAILFKTKEQAAKVGRKFAKKPGYRRFSIGVAPSDMTTASILSDCKQQMFLGGKV